MTPSERSLPLWTGLSGFGEYLESGAVRYCLSLSTGARTGSGSSGRSTGQTTETTCRGNRRRSAVPLQPQPSCTADPGIPHPAVVSRPVNRVVLQRAMSHFALFPRGSSMAAADTHPSPLTVESTPLLVDATAAAALCGKHLRTWRAWWATGPLVGSQSRSDLVVH